MVEARCAAQSASRRRGLRILNGNDARQSRRQLLDPLTAAELEEADAMVADIMKEASRLVHALPHNQAQEVFDGIQRGTSPVAEAIRDKLRAREEARVRVWSLL